jgi:hypothetical protein
MCLGLRHSAWAVAGGKAWITPVRGAASLFAQRQEGNRLFFYIVVGFKAQKFFFIFIFI